MCVGMSLRMRMPVGMIPVSVRMGMSVRVIVRMRMIVPVVMVMPIFGMAMIRHRAVFVQHASVRQMRMVVMMAVDGKRRRCAAAC